MSKIHQEFPGGMLAAVSAFMIWGAAPVYIKLLKQVPVYEIVMHRVVWSFLFLLLLLIFQHRLNELTEAVKNRKIMLVLSLSTILLGFSWFIVNRAIIHNQVLQVSMGYYVSPLFSVIMGVVFFKERLSFLQIISLILVIISVIYLGICHNNFLWLVLSVAFSFVLYTLIRKAAPVMPLVGLCIETFLLAVPALSWLIYLDITGTGSFLHTGIRMDLLLVGTPLITALPLLLLTIGAKKIPFSLLGILQYIMPCGGFILAVFVFDEPLVQTQLRAFILIWIAVFVWVADVIADYRTAA